jgi:hypothetical protein
MTISTARRRGFTIVELMIAIGIFMMVLTAIYSIWMSILKGTRAGLNATAAAQRGRISIRTIEDALVTAQMFVANAKHYYFYADTSTDFGELNLVSRLPASFPGVGRYGDSVVRRVTFSVRPGANSQGELVMTQWPMLAATNMDFEPYSLVLAKDVTLFLLEFWDTNPKINDWVSEWPYTNALPQLMRVSLGLGKSPQRPSEPLDLYTREIALPAAAVQVAWQVPFGAGQRGATNVGGTNLLRFPQGVLPVPQGPFPQPQGPFPQPGGPSQRPIRIR